MLSLKASPKVYIIFGLIAWIPSFLAIPKLIEHPVFPTGLYYSIFATLIFYAWLSAFKLTVKEEQIIYRTLIGGNKTINRKNISRYKITVGDYSDTDRLKPFVRLSVYSLEEKKPILEINLKVFDRKKMRAIFDILDADIAKNKNFR